MEPEKDRSESNIDDLQQARLALRGALDSIRSLQDVNGRLKGQLQKVENHEKALNQRLQSLQSEMTELRAALQKASADANSRLPEQGRHDQMLRLEAQLKQQTLDRELQLASEWYAKERRLMEEHERLIKEERQKVEQEVEKRKAEVGHVRREAEADLRRQEADLRAHYTALIEEQKVLNTTLINERVGALRAEYEASLAPSRKERQELEAKTHRQEAELILLRERLDAATREFHLKEQADTQRIKDLEAQLRAEHSRRGEAEDRIAQVEKLRERDSTDAHNFRAQFVHLEEEHRALQAKAQQAQHQQAQLAAQIQMLEQQLRLQKNSLEETAEKRERVLRKRIELFEETLRRLTLEQEEAVDSSLRTLLQNELARLSQDPGTSSTDAI